MVGLVRNEMRITAPSPQRVLLAKDILVIEAAADTLSTLLTSLGLKLEESVRPKHQAETDESAGEVGSPPAGDEVAPEKKAEGKADGPDKPRASAAEIVLIEMVVLPGPILSGRSASDIASTWSWVT